jgi:hypothetical protein
MGRTSNWGAAKLEGAWLCGSAHRPVCCKGATDVGGGGGGAKHISNFFINVPPLCSRPNRKCYSIIPSVSLIILELNTRRIIDGDLLKIICYSYSYRFSTLDPSQNTFLKPLYVSRLDHLEVSVEGMRYRYGFSL